MPNSNSANGSYGQHIYVHDVDKKQNSNHGIVYLTFRGIKNGTVRLFSKLFKGTISDNGRIAGDYVNNGTNVMKFPLLVTEDIDQSVVSKLCAFLQKERAENIRTFFYNKDVYLESSKDKIAKEFGSNFYESEDLSFDDAEALIELDYYETKDIEDYKHKLRNDESELKLIQSKELSDYNARLRRDELNSKIINDRKMTHLKHINDLEKMKKEHELRQRIHKRDMLSLNSRDNESMFNRDGGLHIQGRELMPIVPTMINIAATDAVNKDQLFQIIGIRYLPHLVPFSEMKVAFKYGILNNRTIMRFIKFLSGDIGFGDLVFGKDKNSLNALLTKISSNEKAWNLNLKNSSQAVTIVMTKEQFDDMCENVVDFTNPNVFKHAQKDIGLIDMIVLDKSAKELIRINAYDNYVPVKHDIREVLNATEKDLVINARIESSKLRNEF